MVVEHLDIAFFIPLLTSLVIGLAATPLVRRLAIRYGWMAHPTQDRWHKRPTALMGGIAIFAAFGVPLLLRADFGSLRQLLQNHSPGAMTHPPALGSVIGIGATLFFALGLVDDIRRIKPHTKLVGQILVASLVAFLGYRLAWFTSMTLDAFFTIIWIVGITNALNLIDNMDGLCAGVGAIAALFLALLYQAQQPESSVIALMLAGALTGFLVFNTNPASIFMGDCGSLVVGFTLAMLCVSSPETSRPNWLATLAVPVLILMVPIFDTTLVTLIRLLSGRKASTGGKDHTSHRLVLMGFSERSAVWFLYVIGLVSGIAALVVSRSDSLTSPAVIIPLALAVLLMGIYMAQLRIYPEREFSRLRNHTFTPVLLELTYKRQLAMVILDFGLVAFSYYLCYRLRFDSGDFRYYFPVFLRSLPAVIGCKLMALYAMGVYRGIWSDMGAADVFAFLKASTAASLLSVAAVTFLYRFRDFSKGIFLIDWLLTTAFLLGTRGFFRLFGDTVKRRTLRGERVMIYGAGRGGELLMRELLNNPRLRMRPVAFIDDDPLKCGKKLQGYPIIGPVGQLEEQLERWEIGGILISIRQTEAQRLQTIKSLCRAHRLFVKQFTICLDPLDLES
jgi:UDP-GlcNAc:undecaprenyl-phosphate GlcNAc-1-phosphate transferase